MSLLADRTIKDSIAKGRIGIIPYDEHLVQPASIDIRLGWIFKVFKNSQRPYIDVKKPLDDLMEEVNPGLRVPEPRVLAMTEEERKKLYLDAETKTHYRNNPFILHPGEFVLGQSLEVLTLPDDIAAQLNGKSSLGRIGLVIHSTAGWCDPGFSGTVTLEMSNDATLPITLYPEMQIGQLLFVQMDQRVEHPYQGKYQNQRKPTATRMFENFPEDDPPRDHAGLPYR